MVNLYHVDRIASRGISNCIYQVYGGVGYFTDIEKNVYRVDIYDSSSKVINSMNDEESEKHLLKSIRIDIDVSDSEYAIIDKIVSTVEKIVLNTQYQDIPQE